MASSFSRNATPVKIKPFYSDPGVTFVAFGDPANPCLSSHPAANSQGFGTLQHAAPAFGCADARFRAPNPTGMWKAGVALHLDGVLRATAWLEGERRAIQPAIEKTPTVDGRNPAPLGGHGKPSSVGISGRFIIPGFLRWCEMGISSTHCMLVEVFSSLDLCEVQLFQRDTGDSLTSTGTEYYSTAASMCASLFRPWNRWFSVDAHLHSKTRVP